MTQIDNLRWLDHLPTGWSALYLDFLADLAANDIPVFVEEVKEKFGSLRIHLEPKVPEARPYIFAAEERSKVTCQQCGDAGELLVRNRVVATLCPAHSDGFSRPAAPPVVTVYIKSQDRSDG